MIREIESTALRCFFENFFTVLINLSKINIIA
jgi:hypothetical protein